MTSRQHRTTPSPTALALGLALMLGSTAAFAIGGVLDKVVDTAKQTGTAVGNTATSTATTVGNTAQQGANAVTNAFAKTTADAVAVYNTASKPVVDTIGKVAVDTSQKLGSKLDSGSQGSAYQVLKDGKVVAHVVVSPQNKIIATRTLDSTGKILSIPSVSGPKYIVGNGQIIGREIIVGGKVVGEEVIDASGKVSANKVLDTGKFALNKAGEFVVNAMAPEVCSALVKTVAAGGKIDPALVPAVPGIPGLPSFETYAAELKKKTDDAKATMGDGVARLQPFLDSLGKSYSVAEMDRLRKVATDNTAKVKQLFANDALLCKGSMAAIDAEITRLGLKTTPVKKVALLDHLPLGGTAYAQSAPQFFNSYTFAASGGAFMGATLQLSIITSANGQGGVYFSFGPMLTSNQAGGISFTLGYFPSVALESFEGLGWSISAAGGPAKKIASAGLEFNIADNWSALQGFGFAAGVGVGLLQADLTFASTYTVKLK